MLELTITGLDTVLKPFFKEELERRLAPVMRKQAKEVTKQLNTAIQTDYTAKQQLKSVLVSEDITWNTIELTYKHKPLPLMEFDVSFSAVSAGQRFKAPNIFGKDNYPNAKGWIKREKPLQEVTVEIKKGKKSVVKRAFMAKINGKKAILRRDTAKTWKRLPTSEDLVGERAPYRHLRGASLAQMAKAEFIKSAMQARLANNIKQAILDELSK